MWDVQKAIASLTTLVMPEYLNDKMLTLNLTMIIAFTSSTRAHEIYSSNIDFLVQHPSFFKNYKNCKAK